MGELTNGALIATVREQIEQAVRTTGRVPGRRKLTAELAQHGVTEYQVRQALAELQRAARPGETGRPATTTPADSGRPVGDGEPATATRPGDLVPRWPLLLLAIPAFVSIWGGWVGLGELAGFGVIKLLPGIWDELRFNSAVTLPIGLETYAAFALHVALSGRAPTRRAQVFAARSAVMSLVLGALGQAAYHLMTAAGIAAAPWWITAIVATLPVVVLGMGAALAHLITQGALAGG